MGEIMVVSEIHPQDAFYEFRKELVGEKVSVLWIRENKFADGYKYCEARLENLSRFVAKFPGNIVFWAVKLSEIGDGDGKRREIGGVGSETGKGGQSKEAQEGHGKAKIGKGA